MAPRFLLSVSLTLALGWALHVSSQAQNTGPADSLTVQFGCTQSSDDPAARVAAAAAVAVLEAKLSRLQRERDLQSDLPPTTDAERDRMRRREQEIADTRVQLADALSRQDCTSTVQIPSQATRGPNDPIPTYIEIPLVYLTDREAASANVTTFYGAKFRGEGMELGTVRVVLPTKNVASPSRPRPKLWKEVNTPAKPVDFLVHPPQPAADATRLTSIVRTHLETAGSKRLLLFIHGFNVSFLEAAVRGGQLAHDLEFGGLVVVYSWPSVGSVLNYPRDEDSGRMAKQNLRQLITDLASSQDIGPIVIFAHSLGTRITADALMEIADPKQMKVRISELVLAAPDINTLEYERFLAPRLKERFDFKTTVYVSSNDLPLKISERLHDYPRLGDPTEYRYVQRDVDIIDASANSPTRKSWGHSYVWDNPNVAADMSNLLNLGRRAETRGLRRANGSSGVPYWILD